MKNYGDMAFQASCAPILDSTGGFPETATAGRVVFVNKRVWIAAEISSGRPIWVPLTNEINTYTHVQSASSTTWTITHNLNSTSPIVQIYDSNYKLIIPDDVAITSNNVVTVTLSTAMTGRAVIMYGDISGTSKGAVSYEYHQTTLSSSWVIEHGLGYYPIVRVFVGSEEILPASVVHDSVFQTTITFSTTKVGYVKFI